MLFACDILEHFKEMIGQSAINRRIQSFMLNSLRGYEGKTTEVWTHLGGDGERASVVVCFSLSTEITIITVCLKLELQMFNYSVDCMAHNAHLFNCYLR